MPRSRKLAEAPAAPKVYGPASYIPSIEQKPFQRPATRPAAVNYFDRLRAHAPRRITAKARREFDEMNRGDR